MRSASWMGTMPRDSFSTPFRRTSGAMISRFSRCLRSALGVRRSAKVAMVLTFQRTPRPLESKKTKLARPAFSGVQSHLVGDVAGDLRLEVCQGHHTQVLISPGAHRNGPVCLLFVAYDQEKRNLLHRMLPDFIVDFLIAQIGFNSKPLFLKRFHHFVGVFRLRLGDI